MDNIALAVLVGYLLGTIPFGLLLSRLAGYGDIRKIGSGNIGATNVLRTGNKPLAALTLLLDGAKGAAAVLLLAAVTGLQRDAMFAGFAAFIGHLFPAWLMFRGGKGVATALGVFIALTPIAGLAACAGWIATAFATRYSSLSALVAVLVGPLAAILVYRNVQITGIYLIMAALVWFRHKGNIIRLLDRTEPRIGRPK